MKYFILFTFIFFLFSLSQAIEVGGHLTEDTIWSQENNPYLVTENLYVDSGVTLTILPGTEIRINAAPCTSSMEFSQYFWLPDNEAKMIWVDGRIIAEGTEQDSILFTKMQDDPNYCWGIIKINQQADICSFKYCKIEYGAGLGIALGDTSRGTVTIYNGKGLFNNCLFNNNAENIMVKHNITESLEIIDCQFSFDSSNSYVKNKWGNYHFTIMPSVVDFKPTLLANNTFTDGRRISVGSVCSAYNYISGSPIFHTGNSYWGFSASYFFNNDFNYCYTGIFCNDENPIYIKNNRFIGGYAGIDISLAYVEISDNYLEGCNLTTYYGNGKIFNNIIQNGEVWTPGEIEIINNVCYNNFDGYGLQAGYNTYCTNNISINNQYDIWCPTVPYNNCIFINNLEHTENYISGNPIFRNCIIDFPLDPPLVDGGGNIIVDSLQALEIFEDIENGDFHLAAGSIAIDAGFDTLGYYYPFDLENSVRVCDGDGDGNAIIDIGAYEYCAPQLGKISGYITETISSEPVDYVFLKANNEPGEFTFADSSGYFEIQLTEGTYDLYAERVFYEDNIIYTVSVENEQNTEVNFNMTYNDPLVNINENELNINNSALKTSNYPNPFNPTTTISFNTVTECNVLVEVFNIKGQKIKTLINKKMDKGQHSVIWNGINKNNQVVSSGIYLYKIRAGKEESVKRMMLLK